MLLTKSICVVPSTQPKQKTTTGWPSLCLVTGDQTSLGKPLEITSQTESTNRSPKKSPDIGMIKV